MARRRGPKPSHEAPFAGMGEAELLARARLALGMTCKDLAELLGVAPKTISRWLGGSGAGGFHLGQLAPHVYPHDAALARELHARGVTLHEEFGAPSPPPLPIPAEARPAASPVREVPPRARVDALVCAACEAIDVSPRALRPALLAAFRAARELDLTIDDVATHLTSPPASPQRPRTIR